jgi:autotransporter-associated beta strand protein
MSLSFPSLCLITALAAYQSLTAQRVWDGESSGLWATATNWSGNTVPGIVEDVLFNNSAAPGNPIIVGGSRTINSFTYSNAGSRVFSTTAGPHSITVSGNTVISLLTGQQLVIGSATAANNVDLITGTLSKNGAGELQLFGGNTIGDVSVFGGTLTTRNSNALAGSSSVTLSGGTLRLISGLSRPIVMAGGGVVENLSDDAVRIPIMTEGTSGLGSLRIRSMISAASGTMTFSIAPINHDGDLVLENSGAGTSVSSLGTVRINSAIGANVDSVTVSNTTTGTRGVQTVLLVSPNLYTGTTTIDANALLEILAANIIPDSSATTVNGTLNLRTFSETIGALSGSGTVAKSTGNRTFTIGSGGGDGNFTGTFNNGTSGTLFVLKTGAGSQTFSSASTHSGGTTVSQGTLRISNTSGSATGSNSVQVFLGATLTGSGSAAGSLNVEGTINPGNPVGTLSIGGNATFSSGSTLRIAINDSSSPKNDLLAVTGSLSATGSTLNFDVTGFPAQPIYIVATYSGTPPSDFTATNVPAGYVVDFAHNGNSIALRNPYLIWATEPQQALTAGVNAAKTDDPNGNGVPNLLEFATNGTPASGFTNPRLRKEIVDVDPTAGVSMALTITLPVRIGAVFSGPGNLVSQSVDGIVYRIESSGDLVNFNTPSITEITNNTAIISALGITPPSSGWALRTFRAPGTPGTSSREFIRVGVQ